MDTRLRTALRTADPARVAHEAARTMAPVADLGTAACLACGGLVRYDEGDRDGWPADSETLARGDMAELDCPCGPGCPNEGGSTECVVVWPHYVPLATRVKAATNALEDPDLEPHRVLSWIQEWRTFTPPSAWTDEACSGEAVSVGDTAAGLYWYCLTHRQGASDAHQNGRVLDALRYAPAAGEKGPESDWARTVYAMLAGQEWEDLTYMDTGDLPESMSYTVKPRSLEWRKAGPPAYPGDTRYSYERWQWTGTGDVWVDDGCDYPFKLQEGDMDRRGEWLKGMGYTPHTD